MFTLPRSPRCLLLPLILGSGIATAQPLSLPAFSGVYHRVDVDSVSGLHLLPDQTFCFTLMAGALDMLAPGSWRQTSHHGQQTTLELTRGSRFPDRFVVRQSKTADDNEESEKPAILINIPTFSMLQPDTILGTGNSTALPDNLAPMFAPGQSSFSHYPERLPLTHRYLFLGFADAAGAYHINRFDLGQQRQYNVYLNVDEAATHAGETWSAEFDGHKLLLDGSDMGKPAPLSQALKEEVRRECLAPIATESAHYRLLRTQQQYHLPSLPPGRKPWFPAD